MRQPSAGIFLLARYFIINVEVSVYKYVYVYVKGEVNMARAKVITFGIPKGGAGKTTTAAVTAFLLAEEGYKVLVADLDPQGNSTEIFTLVPIRDYRGKGIGGILEALDTEGQATKKNIIVLNDNIHLLIGSEILGVFPRPGYKDKIQLAVKKMLEPVIHDYDFVILDTAPALNFLLTSCLCASDGVVALFETGKFCYSALLSFVESIQLIQDDEKSLNQNIKLLGILCSMIDSRRTDNNDFLEMVKADEQLGPFCFNTVIKRQAAAGRLAYAGFFDNSEIKHAVGQYRPFVKELIERCQHLK